jgi:hypothetical protein
MPYYKYKFMAYVYHWLGLVFISILIVTHSAPGEGKKGNMLLIALSFSFFNILETWTSIFSSYK